MPLTHLRARFAKAFGLEPHGMVHPGEPGLCTGHDSTQDPEDDPAEDRADAPAHEPVHEPTHDPDDAPTTYVVEDRAGVVVGLSDEPVTADTPAAHAAWLIRYAIDSDGLRGRWVLASVLKTVYRRSIQGEGVEPAPWPTVAGLVGQVVPHKTKWVRIGGQRRRRLAYFIPERIEDVVPNNAVPLDARRA